MTSGMKPPREKPHRPWLISTILLILVIVFAGVGVYTLIGRARSGATQPLSTPTLVPSSKTIEIASEFPTSALETTTGLPLQRGVQMAIDDANNNNLLPDGYKVELTYYNDVGKGDRSDPTIGVDDLHKAIADNLVAGVIGPYYSRVAQQELSIANQEPIALISPSTIYACLTKTVSDDPNCQGSDDIEADMRPTSQLTYFRLATTDDREGLAVADYFFNVQHYKKVILIQDDKDPYIAMLAKTFKQEWELHGQIIPLAIKEIAICEPLRDPEYAEINF